MRFNIITNMNGVGLEQDAVMLRHELESRGHQVACLQFADVGRYATCRADMNIFLEVVVEQFYGLAPVQWLVVNPEWTYPMWNLTPFRYVLAKTIDAATIFSKKVNGKCRYIGWKARDLYRPDVKRERKFLHVCGKSKFKNTEAVKRGCQLAGVECTVVGDGYVRLQDEDLAALFNSHQYFLCPSAYEGFGMALHEALSCGACVITTDAPPMNEIEPAMLIHSCQSAPHNLGTLHTVNAEDVASAVKMALAFSDAELDEWRERSRETYEGESRSFGKALDDLLKEAA
jgi:hypothetical protein